MPDRRQITSASAPAPAGAYSQGRLADGWLFVSGQGPIDPATGAITGKTVEEQTVQTLTNVKAIVEEAGGTMSDVVSCTVYLADISEFPRFNTTYEAFFDDPKPTRTTVQSTLVGGIRIEITVVARIPNERE